VYFLGIYNQLHILRLYQAWEVGAQDIAFIKWEFIEFPLNSCGYVMSLLWLSCAAGCCTGVFCAAGNECFHVV